MPYDPIHGQGQGLKVVTMANFKGYLLCQYACNQKTNNELWHSKTTSKFRLDRFEIVDILSCVGQQSCMGCII